MQAPKSHNKNSSYRKPPPEFIEYLKNTPQLPLKENSQTKKSLHPYDQKPELKKEGLQKSKITEGDFSKISSSYVLEGNFLRKQEIYEDSIAKQKKKQ